MRGVTHFTMGWLAGAVVCSSAGADSFILIAGASAAAVGSLVPDIDHHNSIISRRVILPFYFMFKHRGITHSPLIPAAIALYAAAFVLNPIHQILWLAFAAGYAAHLAGDGITKSGIYLSPRRRIHLIPKKLRITTGNISERLVLVLVTLLCIPVLYPAGIQLWHDSDLIMTAIMQQTEYIVRDFIYDIRLFFS